LIFLAGAGRFQKTGQARYEVLDRFFWPAAGKKKKQWKKTKDCHDFRKILQRGCLSKCPGDNREMFPWHILLPQMSPRDNWEMSQFRRYGA